ncbi:MAG: ORC-CDC6 family AAA ATPase [Candidatus Scalindua sp.]
MNHSINPFQELYVTDDPDPKVYVGLFSNVLVERTKLLFQPGNTILKGVQGTGKSMLLSLFRPKIRCAYYDANVEFPISKDLRNFVGAGINLTRSGILNFGQRPIDEDYDEQEMPLFFGDFLNYYIVEDIFTTIQLQANLPNVFDKLITSRKLDEFAKELSKQDCWFEYLKDCDNFKDVWNRIKWRIKQYRQFHINRLFKLDIGIQQTKTNAGEPIARTANLLKTIEVVPESTNFFVRIDQLEILLRGDVVNKKLGTEYRKIINKIIGDRDASVSYRIGTRRYDWDKELKIFATDNKLEHLRDYKIADIDKILRRQEDIKTWIFPEFAEDVFEKRFVHSGVIDDSCKSGNLIVKIFGRKHEPKKKIDHYLRKNKNPDSVMSIEEDWSDSWKDFLRELFQSDALEAVLAAAWARQSGKKDKPGDRLKSPPPSNKPWKETYWHKERIQQALMQVASRSNQRMLWAGYDDIIGLSSGNISIFLSICYEIWEMFLRTESRKIDVKRVDPINSEEHVDNLIQSTSIYNASYVWYKKITEQPDGDDRQRFVDFLGSQCKKWLNNDKSMSYPGRNGFSVSSELFQEFEECQELRNFLNDSVDYGDLYDMLHTTKKTDRKGRTKWYLAPILSPYFQIPHQHVKEPYYLENISELYKWVVEESGVCQELKAKKSLFDGIKKKHENTYLQPPWFDKSKESGDE